MTKNEVTTNYMDDLLNVLNDTSSELDGVISDIDGREGLKKWWFEHLRENGHEINEIGRETQDDKAIFDEAIDKLSEASDLINEVIESLETIIED